VIVIDEVEPNAQEVRPIQRGWGLIHWVGCLPIHLPILAAVIFGVTVTALAGDYLPPLLLGGYTIGTVVLWTIASRWAQAVVAAEARKSPVSGLSWRWTIDDQGFAFDNGLQSNRLDWRAIKAIRDESDRFVFLVSPQYNPVLPSRLLGAVELAQLRALIGEVTASGRLGRGVD